MIIGTGISFGRGITISDVAGGAYVPTPDPYYSNVVLLLHADGTNGSGSFIDSSPAPKTMSASSGTTISTTRSKFNGASGKFDGTAASRLSTPYNTDFVFGSGDFTIEFWMNIQGIIATAQELISFWSNVSGWAWEVVVVPQTNTLHLGFNGNNTFSTLTFPFVLDTWYHIALSNNSNTLRMYLNGALYSTVPNVPTIQGTSAELSIGAVSSPDTWKLNGYLDEIRITKGVGRYLTAFTVEPVPFYVDPYFANVTTLLHMDGVGTTYTDIKSSGALVVTGAATQSTTQSKFGGKSHFNGSSISGNCLKLGTNADSILIFPGDFTVECWFFQTADTEYNYSGLVTRLHTGDRVSSGFSSFELGVYYTGGQYRPSVNVFNTANGNFACGYNLSVSLNTWNHVAVTRSGNTLRLYVNGVLSTSSTATGAQVSNIAQTMIGASGTGTDPRHSFNGYIDDVRITTGVARYITDFTPPTTSFPNT